MALTIESVNNVQNSPEGTYYPLLPSLVLLYGLPVYKSFGRGE